jgi:hypothetical protein
MHKLRAVGTAVFEDDELEVLGIAWDSIWALAATVLPCLNTIAAPDDHGDPVER